MRALASLGSVCTSGTPYTTGLDGGLAGAISPTQRKMTNGTSFVLYGIFRDVVRSQPFGDAIGTHTVAGMGTGLPQTVPVFGRVAPSSLSFSMRASCQLDNLI